MRLALAFVVDRAGQQDLEAETALAVDVCTQGEGEVLLADADLRDAVVPIEAGAVPPPPQLHELGTEEATRHDQVAQAVVASVESRK